MNTSELNFFIDTRILGHPLEEGKDILSKTPNLLEGKTNHFDVHFIVYFTGWTVILPLKLSTKNGKEDN